MEKAIVNGRLREHSLYSLGLRYGAVYHELLCLEAAFILEPVQPTYEMISIIELIVRLVVWTCALKRAW